MHDNALDTCEVTVSGIFQSVFFVYPASADNAGIFPYANYALAEHGDPRHQYAVLRHGPALVFDLYDRPVLSELHTE